MFLTELFDKPAQIESQVYDQSGVKVTFNVDGVPYKFFAYQLHGEPGIWEVEFTGQGTTKITGTGNEIKVFSTVVQIMKNMLQLYHIEKIYFTAEEPSRRKLYNRLVDKLLPSWHKFVDSEYGGFVVTKG